MGARPVADNDSIIHLTTVLVCTGHSRSTQGRPWTRAAASVRYQRLILLMSPDLLG